MSEDCKKKSSAEKPHPFEHCRSSAGLFIQENRTVKNFMLVCMRKLDFLLSSSYCLLKKSHPPLFSHTEVLFSLFFFGTNWAHTISGKGWNNHSIPAVTCYPLWCVSTVAAAERGLSVSSILRKSQPPLFSSRRHTEVTIFGMFFWTNCMLLLLTVRVQIGRANLPTASNQNSEGSQNEISYYVYSTISLFRRNTANYGRQ